MLSILRGAAGALSDLVEQEARQAKGVAAKHPANSGGDTRPPPRAVKARSAKEEARPASEYSYETEAEEQEEEVRIEEEADYERSPSKDRGAEGSRLQVAKPSSRARVTPVDPHYLSKALNLSSAPKRSAKFREREASAESEGGHKRHHDDFHERHNEEEKGRGPGGGGSAQPRTPDKPPLERRKPVRDPRKRKRGSGGKSKRERGQQFKEWVEERKRAKAEEQRWHQRRR